MNWINAIVFGLVAFFVLYDLYDALRKFIGHNPNGPSIFARIKAWWPGFVKRHIVDDDPFDDESHSATRNAAENNDPTSDMIEAAIYAAKEDGCAAPAYLCKSNGVCPGFCYHGDGKERAHLAQMWLVSHGISEAE